MCGNDTQIFHGFDAFSSGTYSTGETLPLGSNAGVTSSALYGNHSAADASSAATNAATLAKTVNARAFISFLLTRPPPGCLTFLVTLDPSAFRKGSLSPDPPC